MITGWDVFLTYENGDVEVFHTHQTIHELLNVFAELDAEFAISGEETPVRIQVIPAH